MCEILERLDLMPRTTARRAHSRAVVGVLTGVEKNCCCAADPKICYSMKPTILYSYDPSQATAQSDTDLLARKQVELEESRRQLEEAQRQRGNAVDEFGAAEERMARAQYQKTEADELDEDATRELEQAAAESKETEQAFELAQQLFAKERNLFHQGDHQESAAGGEKNDPSEVVGEPGEHQSDEGFSKSLTSWTRVREAEYEVQHFRERFGFDEGTPWLWTTAGAGISQPRGIQNTSGSDCFFSSFLQMVGSVRGSFSFGQDVFEQLCGGGSSARTSTTSEQAEINPPAQHLRDPVRTGLLRSGRTSVASNRVCMLAWFVSQELRNRVDIQVPSSFVGHIRNEFGNAANGRFDSDARAVDFRTRQNDSSEAALLFLQDYAQVLFGATDHYASAPQLETVLESSFFPTFSYQRRQFACRPRGVIEEATVQAILQDCWRQAAQRELAGSDYYSRQDIPYNFLGHRYTLSLGEEQSETLSVLKPDGDFSSNLLSVSGYWNKEYGVPVAQTKPPVQWSAADEEDFNLSEEDGDFLSKCGECFERPMDVPRFDREFFFQQRYGPTKLAREPPTTVTTLDAFLARQRVLAKPAEYCMCRRMEGLLVKKETFAPAWYGHVLARARDRAAPNVLLFAASGEAVHGRIFSLDIVRDSRWRARGLRGDPWYELRSFVCKIGGAGGGHYYAIAKYKNQWFRADDQTVVPLGAGQPTCVEEEHRVVVGLWEKEGDDRGPRPAELPEAQEPETAEFLAADASTRFASSRQWLAFLSGRKAPAGSAVSPKGKNVDDADVDQKQGAEGDVDVPMTPRQSKKRPAPGVSGSPPPVVRSPPRKRGKDVRFDEGETEEREIEEVDDDVSSVASFFSVEGREQEDDPHQYVFDDPEKELRAMQEQNVEERAATAPPENNGPIWPPPNEDGPHHREFDSRTTERSAQGSLLSGKGEPIKSSCSVASQYRTADYHAYSETHQHSATGRVHNTGTAAFSEGGSSRAATAVGLETQVGTASFEVAPGYHYGAHAKGASIKIGNASGSLVGGPVCPTLKKRDLTEEEKALFEATERERRTKELEAANEHILKRREEEAEWLKLSAEEKTAKKAKLAENAEEDRKRVRETRAEYNEKEGKLRKLAEKAGAQGQDGDAARQERIKRGEELRKEREEELKKLQEQQLEAQKKKAEAALEKLSPEERTRRKEAAEKLAKEAKEKAEESKKENKKWLEEADKELSGAEKEALERKEKREKEAAEERKKKQKAEDDKMSSAEKEVRKKAQETKKKEKEQAEKQQALQALEQKKKKEGLLAKLSPEARKAAEEIEENEKKLLEQQTKLKRKEEAQAELDRESLEREETESAEKEKEWERLQAERVQADLSARAGGLPLVGDPVRAKIALKNADEQGEDGTTRSVEEVPAGTVGIVAHFFPDHGVLVCTFPGGANIAVHETDFKDKLEALRPRGLGPDDHTPTKPEDDEFDKALPAVHISTSATGLDVNIGSAALVPVFGTPAAAADVKLVSANVGQGSFGGGLGGASAHAEAGLLHGSFLSASATLGGTASASAHAALGIRAGNFSATALPSASASADTVFNCGNVSVGPPGANIRVSPWMVLEAFCNLSLGGGGGSQDGEKGGGGESGEGESGGGQQQGQQGSGGQQGQQGGSQQGGGAGGSQGSQQNGGGGSAQGGSQNAGSQKNGGGSQKNGGGSSQTGRKTGTPQTGGAGDPDAPRPGNWWTKMQMKLDEKFPSTHYHKDPNTGIWQKQTNGTMFKWDEKKGAYVPKTNQEVLRENYKKQGPDKGRFGKDSMEYQQSKQARSAERANREAAAPEQRGAAPVKSGGWEPFSGPGDHEARMFGAASQDRSNMVTANVHPEPQLGQRNKPAASETGSQSRQSSASHQSSATTASVLSSVASARRPPSTVGAPSVVSGDEHNINASNGLQESDLANRANKDISGSKGKNADNESEASASGATSVYSGKTKKAAKTGTGDEQAERSHQQQRNGAVKNATDVTSDVDTGAAKKNPNAVTENDNLQTRLDKTQKRLEDLKDKHKKNLTVGECVGDTFDWFDAKPDREDLMRTVRDNLTRAKVEGAGQETVSRAERHLELAKRRCFEERKYFLRPGLENGNPNYPKLVDEYLAEKKLLQPGTSMSRKVIERPESDAGSVTSGEKPADPFYFRTAVQSLHVKNDEGQHGHIMLFSTHAEDDYVGSFGDSRLQHGTDRGSRQWRKMVNAAVDVLDKARQVTVNHRGDAASSIKTSSDRSVHVVGGPGSEASVGSSGSLSKPDYTKVRVRQRAGRPTQFG